MPERVAQVSLLAAGAAALAVGLALGLYATRFSASSKRCSSSKARKTGASRLTPTEEADTGRECRIVLTSNILLMLSTIGNELSEPKDGESFCGTVITDLSSLPSLCGKTVYLCGDIAKACAVRLDTAERVFVIQELSQNYESLPWPVVDMGRVPILLNGVGVYYRRFFDPEQQHFKAIRAEHAFQTLTESNKPGTAHRTGIYLTPVEQKGHELHFRLLRCSSNLSGPTGNFCAHDHEIIEALNHEASCIFENRAPLNHVLAQIYHNMPAMDGKKSTKARIKAHSDKTKDMPENGLIAFCTFYDKLDKLKPLGAFDYGHKGLSGLTKLRFRLKPCVEARPGCTLRKEFSVTLYPNSVFFLPLSSNRLYTHEIQPSMLDGALLPTRLGYVVRCSATEAVHKAVTGAGEDDAQTGKSATYLKLEDGGLCMLQEPTPEGMAELRQLYAEENKTDEFIDYGQRFLFSMNRGDYIKPATYEMGEEFRWFEVDAEYNLFEELWKSARFEDVGKGRKGTVLVKSDTGSGVPIVRTTSKYSSPAQCFGSVHSRLADQVQKVASIPVDFNNALIETYQNSYASMGFHSDQALDLEDGSYIALLSCYRNPELAKPPRKLVVESKETGGSTFEIPLTHNSVIAFSVDTNRRFRHKIVLDINAHPPENQWLGVTFRTSKTFVRFRDERAFLGDGTSLTLADKEQRSRFFMLRGEENKTSNFTYPKLTYTISDSDIMPPI